MSKRVKILVAVLAAVMLLSIGTTAVVLAKDNTQPAQAGTAARGLLARVAEKLGIPEQQLADTVKQARQEMRDETIAQKLDNLLANAVTKGTITQHESDAIKAWWNGQPEAVGKLLPLVSNPDYRNLMMRSDMPINYITLEMRYNGTPEMFRAGQLPDVAGILQNAVGKGVITQQEADAITAWWNGRPDAVNKLLQGVLYKLMPYTQTPCLPAN